VVTKPVCRIRVDLFERKSGVPDALRELGVDMSFEHLGFADYDLGSGARVERKTIVDFRLSLQRGRLWRQIGGLRDGCARPYLLIEGSRDDWTNDLRGACLAVIGQGVPVLFAARAEDSAQWLRLVALRCSRVRLGRDRPVYAQRLKPPAQQVREAMLAAVPGISVARARALLQRFGTIERIVAADANEWLTVKGIGPAIAKSLREAIS
jgi:ERCC4-type nuclease